MFKRSLILPVGLVLSLPILAQEAPEGMNGKVYGRMMAQARETGSDALVIMKDGKVLVNERFGRPEGPIEMMSATKSVVGLALVMLLEDGRIRSLEQPVADFFPEWKQGRKAKITVGHLLSHTSGLQNEPHANLEINGSRDFVQLALAAELVADPGTRFNYNNKAVNLLAGVVQKACGQPLDAFLNARLFKPMGITDFLWDHDPAGNPHAMSGLKLRPLDVARIGQMVMDGGVWEGRRLISEAWIKAATLTSSQAVQPQCGLLWWLMGGVEVGPILEAQDLLVLKKAGLDPVLLKGAERLVGRHITSDDELPGVMKEAFGDEGLRVFREELAGRGLGFRPRRVAPPTGFYAEGDLGQYLVVVPAQRLVAVRMRREREGDQDMKVRMAAGFRDFPGLVRALTRPSKG